MPTDERVLAGGPVLATDIATQGSATWPALTMVVVGLVLAIAGLAILTGRGRRTWASSPRGDASPEPRTDSSRSAARAPALEPARVATTSSAPPEPVEEGRPGGGADPPGAQEPVAAAPRETPAPAPRDARPHTVDGGGPCDWELRVDVSDGEDAVVVRRASGPPCCVHVLHVRPLDALPPLLEREDQTWSGDRTRIGPSRAVSDVRSDRRRVRPEARGLALGLTATIDRQDRRHVITTAEDAGADEFGQTTAERLWAVHLARLRDAKVVSDTEEGPARLQTATRYRTRVALRTTRSCRTGGHRLHASADVSVVLEGEVTPAPGARLTLPNVGGWVEGDLEAATTDPVEVAPGTEVHPAPGLDGTAGLAVGAAPGSGEVRAGFVGHAERSVVDGGVELLVACAVVADVGLGDAAGHPAAEGRVSVAVDHRVALVVTPHASHVGTDDVDRPDLGCSCAPAYEVQFGVGPEDAPQAPHARLHVGGRSFRLDADARPGADQMPSWTVRAEAGDDEPRRGTTG